jgi:hypothetical protein
VKNKTKPLLLTKQMKGQILAYTKIKHQARRVAHACNPSYSGGRDQEDGSLRPAWAKEISKTPSQSISWVW